MFEKCICKDYEYYVFADVDLLFKSNFCLQSFADQIQLELYLGIGFHIRKEV